MRIQASLAERNNVALITLVEDNTYTGQIVNDNSICQTMQHSPEHAKLCDLDCGTAYSRAIGDNRRIEYLCHARLKCFALPIQKSGPPLVVLGGRSFTSSATYSEFLTRYDDFVGLQTGAALKNIQFTDSRELADIAEMVSSTAEAHFEKAVMVQPRADDPDLSTNLLDTHLEIIRLSDELENKKRALAQFQEFLRDVAPSLDSQTLYIEVLKKFNVIMKAERSSLMLYNPEAEELSFRSGCGSQFRGFKQNQSPTGRGRQRSSAL